MNEVLAALGVARRVAIVAHRDPDPDTIGAAIALGLGLERGGISVSLHCADSVPEGARFLKASARFSADPPPADVDLIVTVDFGDRARAKFALPARPLANIDHHASNSRFGTMNWVDATASSTCEMIGRLVDALGVGWSPEMATAALTGIMTDTGSFQFPSTDVRTYERAARLREAGADLQSITYNIFRNVRYEALKLYGMGFARLVREADGLLVWSEIHLRDVAEAAARDDDVSGLVQQLARASGNRLTLLFGEAEGAVRVSCRTSEWSPSIDAAALMGRFGGGGHIRAAGALIPGTLEAVRERVLTAAREVLQAARATA
ncbi:MAG: bifunctional oligoribonuclease/PAP phosphatase NrnA [Chloroflexi bacterium]|nr:bifunctional oligoribonuclease/PAP phosphatase NrnA [Chloroflexota bacterium]